MEAGLEVEQLRNAVAWNETQRGAQAREIERLRTELHRVSESRRGQREEAERLRGENTVLEAKLAECERWTTSLQALIDRHNDERRECPVIE